MANDIISRSDAKAQGLKRYFTGEPCSKGHISDRYVADWKCARCVSILALARSKRWDLNNPEKRKEKYRRYRLRHPDKISVGNDLNATKQRALRKQKAAEEGRIIWQHLSPEERLKHRREYYRNRYYAKSLEQKRAERAKYKNLEREKTYFAKWNKENPDRVAAKGHKRRAQKLNSSGAFTHDDLARIMKAQNGKCAYCRLSLSKRKKHVDHILPLSCGGSNDRTNIQYLCAPCNLTKGAKDPILFAQELGRLL